MRDCMICDLYAAMDRQLGYSDPEGIAAEVCADIVSILPPRGHAFHKLAIWEQTYRSRPPTD